MKKVRALVAIILNRPVIANVRFVGRISLTADNHGAVITNNHFADVTR